MARPTKWRRITHFPKVRYFIPVSQEFSREKIDFDYNAADSNVLFLEEVEALRLRDLEGLEQVECAQRMAVSRPTFHRILANAREKLSDSIVNGKGIRIAGGNYAESICHVLCGNCGRKYVEGFVSGDCDYKAQGIRESRGMSKEQEPGQGQRSDENNDLSQHMVKAHISDVEIDPDFTSNSSSSLNSSSILIPNTSSNEKSYTCRFCGSEDINSIGGDGDDFFGVFRRRSAEDGLYESVPGGRGSGGGKGKGSPGGRGMQGGPGGKGRSCRGKGGSAGRGSDASSGVQRRVGGRGMQGGPGGKGRSGRGKGGSAGRGPDASSGGQRRAGGRGMQGGPGES